MKNKILIWGICSILIIALFALTGCSNKENDERSLPNNQDNVESLESGEKSSNVQISSEDFLKKYFEEIEKNNETDEYINPRIEIAVLASEKYDIDYDEIYNALSNLDKGANYINKNYKDFSKMVLEDLNWNSLHTLGPAERAKFIENIELTDSDIEKVQRNLEKTENTMRYGLDICGKTLNSGKFKVEKIEKSENVKNIGNYIVREIEKYKPINENLEWYNISISFEYENQEYNIDLVVMLGKVNNKIYIANIEHILEETYEFRKIMKKMEELNPLVDALDAFRVVR